MTEKINVMKIEPGKWDCSFIEIPNTLEALQAEVGGCIDVIPIPGFDRHNFRIVCNQNGLMEGLPINENLIPFFFVGTCLIVIRYFGEFKTISAKEEKILIDWLEALRKEDNI